MVVVTHNLGTGLGLGYTLDCAMRTVSKSHAGRTLADMPFIGEEYYHQFKWHKAIPQPTVWPDDCHSHQPHSSATHITEKACLTKKTTGPTNKLCSVDSHQQDAGTISTSRCKMAQL